MKKPLKEKLKQIGGGHLLSEVSRDKVDVKKVSKKMEKSKWFGKFWAKAILKKYRNGVSERDLQNDLPDYIPGRDISDLFK
jgi:hypothetical protein